MVISTLSMKRSVRWLRQLLQPLQKAWQLTIQETADTTQKRDINNSRALHIHTKIGVVIALDYQSFLIVDDVGFVHLLHSLEPRYVIPSRKYKTKKVMLKIFDTVEEVVVGEITGVTHMSLTNDLWSITVSVNSLMSLTAHWLLRHSRESV